MTRFITRCKLQSLDFEVRSSLICSSMKNTGCLCAGGVVSAVGSENRLSLQPKHSDVSHVLVERLAWAGCWELQ